MVDITGFIDCTIDDPSGNGDCSGGFLTRCIMVGTNHTGIDTTNPGRDYSVTKHTGRIVLQRMKHHDGKSFIASSFFETESEADSYASLFNNVVAIMPIEWEE